jgi:uncharacterized membrane protein YgcG
MNKIYYRYIISIILLNLFITINAQDLSKPHNYVNDYAEIIPAVDEDSLNKKISNYEKSSGVEIAVVTIQTLGDNNIDDFSQDLFEKWGVGKSASDNGILIVIALEDRQWRIHTGYGAEILLPDLLAKRLGEERLVPDFRAKNYSGGINSLVDEIMNKIGSNSADIQKFKNDYIVKKEAQDKKFNHMLATVGIAFLIIIGFLSFIFFVINRYKKFKNTKEQIKTAKSTILSRVDVIHANLDSILTKYSLDTLQQVEEIKKDCAKINDKKINDNTLRAYNNILAALTDFMTNSSNYKKSCEIIKNSSYWIGEAQSTLSRVNTLNDYLKEYNVNKILKYNITDVNFLIQSAQNNINSDELILFVKALTNYINSITTFENELKSIKNSIPIITSELKNYKSTINSWISKLESYHLSSVIANVNKSTIQLEKVVNTIAKDQLFKVYGMLTSIIAYAKQNYDEAYRKKEDEEAAELRRQSAIYNSGYNSGYSSSYSSESSSSFGGFGGGDSGGGGAQGSW